jgi:hypothetical protein
MPALCNEADAFRGRESLTSTARKRRTVIRFCRIYLGGGFRDIGRPKQESLEKLVLCFFFVYK